VYELNSNPSIHGLLTIINRVGRDVTRHVTPPDDDVRPATSTSAPKVHLTVHKEDMAADVPQVPGSDGDCVAIHHKPQSCRDA